MRWRVDLSKAAEHQFLTLPPKVRTRVARALDELNEHDDSQWSNVKALQGPQWKGRYRKRVGPYRIIFRKNSERGTVEISAILARSEDTYRRL